MRPYRGLTKEGIWHYGWYIELDGKSHIFPCGLKRFCSVEVIPETVGQFTGLKDKNGTEIYEGDIVRQEDERFLSGHKDRIVEWGVGCYMLRDTHIPQSIQLSGGGHPWEIIGTIHTTHPELLEQGNG